MQKNVIWYSAAGVLVLLAGVALLISWRAHHGEQPAPVAAAPAPPAPPAPPAIANPVPAEASAGGPLPPLDASDKPLRDSMVELLGGKTVEDLFRPEMLIRHIVVTVDNLPRRHDAVEMRPTKALPGKFLVNGADDSPVIDPSTYQRYAPYVHTLQELNTQRFAALYFHYYPLFQQAYENLGYPNGYFNDRLIESIDDALAAPDVRGPVALTRPNVMYQYADPKIESLSYGQRLMVRLGPDNEAIVKLKLHELRSALAAQKRP
jgi:hypothetical protein